MRGSVKAIIRDEWSSCSIRAGPILIQGLHGSSQEMYRIQHAHKSMCSYLKYVHHILNGTLQSSLMACRQHCTLMTHLLLAHSAV